MLGVGVSLVNMDRALDEIDRLIRAGDRTYVCVCSVHGVMECQRSDELRRIFNSAGMVTPDGMPVIGRVPGWSGITIATGHFRDGVLLAPITAELVGDLVEHRKPRLTVDAFDPARFKLRAA